MWILLGRSIGRLFRGALRWLEVLLEVDRRVLALVVPFYIGQVHEEFGALVAFERRLDALLLGGKLEQVLVGSEGLLLDAEFLAEGGVLDLAGTDGLLHLEGLLVRTLVVEVEALSDRLQVVLRVDQILNGELREAEKFHEMGVAEALCVVLVEPCVGYVLQQSFELAQVALGYHALQVSGHQRAPVDAALALLKLKWRWQGH